MSNAFTVDIEGIPIPQGSLVSNGYGRGLRHSNQAKLQPWRYAVVAALQRSAPSTWDPSLPVSVTATFRFPRPQSHYGTGRNSHTLKPSAPSSHAVKPDADKCARALGDSIEASGLIRGDQQIVRWDIAKRYCRPDEHPGVLLTLIPLRP
jgi:Holliday junction resolvase RusA-like endonuclease